MAARLLPLDEAAKYLGISPEELTAMRSRNEIYGYRDGSSWKFKQDELDRVKSERQSGSGIGSSPSLGGSGRIEPDIEELSELVSEEGLGQSAVGGSTIIGKDGLPTGGESDIQLTGSHKGSNLSAMSDVELVGSGMGSDVQLVGSGLGSDVGLGGSGKQRGSDKDLPSLSAAESDLRLTDSIDVGSDLNLGEGSGKGSGKRGGSTKIPAGAGSDEFAVGSDIGVGSGLNLGEDDGDLVLGGPGSDVTLGAADSGINLAGVKDSGLSLDEQPLELAGGSHVESLELGEDESSSVSLAETADPEMATQLKADDDFLLTPVEETGEGDTDSGSQVIALDTDEFDQTAPTMLGGNLAAPLLEEEGQPMGGVDMAGAGVGPGYAPLGGVAPTMAPMIGEAPETPYTIWNVLLLLPPFIALAICGMMMVDVLRNMWSWDQPYTLNSSLIEAILPKQ